MTPILIAAIVAGSLFTTGVVVEPTEPVLGRTLQGAGVGTMIGGALGTAAGAATALGVTTATASVATAGALGAGTGAAVGYMATPKKFHKTQR